MNGLTAHQLRGLVKDGWCLIDEQQIGSREAVRRALRRINLWCADVMLPTRTRGFTCLSLRDFSDESYCVDIRTSPVFLDLVEGTGVRAIIDDLIGPTAPVDPQIALRFPDPDSANTSLASHVDGFGRRERIDCFNLLAGFYLSDIDHEHMGNFSVWPGSHCLLAEFFSQHSTQKLVADQQFARVEQLMSQLSFGKPVQVRARAGDVVLAHYLLRHGPALNQSEKIRYMVFVRFRSDKQPRGDARHLGDLWRYWNDAALNVSQ